MSLQELDRPDFLSLSVVKSGSEFQASYEVTRGSFRVRFGTTPSEAVRDVLGLGDPDVLIPPPPY